MGSSYSSSGCGCSSGYYEIGEAAAIANGCIAKNNSTLQQRRYITYIVGAPSVRSVSFITRQSDRNFSRIIMRMQRSATVKRLGFEVGVFVFVVVFVIIFFEPFHSLVTQEA